MKNGIFFEDAGALKKYISENIINSRESAILQGKRAESLINNMTDKYIRLNRIYGGFYCSFSLGIIIYFLTSNLLLPFVLMLLSSKIMDRAVRNTTVFGSECLLSNIFDLIAIKSKKVYEDDLVKKNMNEWDEKIEFLDKVKHEEFGFDLSFLGIFLVWFLSSFVSAIGTGFNISHVVHLAISSFFSYANVKNMREKASLIDEKRNFYVEMRDSLAVASSSNDCKIPENDISVAKKRVIKNSYSYNPNVIRYVPSDEETMCKLKQRRLKRK